MTVSSSTPSLSVAEMKGSNVLVSLILWVVKPIFVPIHIRLSGARYNTNGIILLDEGGLCVSMGKCSNLPSKFLIINIPLSVANQILSCSSFSISLISVNKAGSSAFGYICSLKPAVSNLNTLL